MNFLEYLHFSHNTLLSLSINELVLLVYFDSNSTFCSIVKSIFHCSISTLPYSFSNAVGWDSMFIEVFCTIVINLLNDLPSWVEWVFWISKPVSENFLLLLLDYGLILYRIKLWFLYSFLSLFKYWRGIHLLWFHFRNVHWRRCPSHSWFILVLRSEWICLEFMFLMRLLYEHRLISLLVLLWGDTLLTVKAVKDHLSSIW